MLGEIGVGKESAADILKALKAESVDALAALVGGDSDAIKEIKQLFAIANGYPPNSRARTYTCRRAPQSWPRHG
jgi:hypothetical protein